MARRSHAAKIVGTARSIPIKGPHSKMTVFSVSSRSISKPLITLFGCIFLLVISGCGGRGPIVSIQVNPTSVDLKGIGATQQLTVNATYSDGSKFDVTSQTSFSIATPNPLGPFTPDNAVAVSGSGQAQSVMGACTWTAIVSNNVTSYGTQPYVITGSFDGQTGTTFASVDSVVGCPHP